MRDDLDASSADAPTSSSSTPTKASALHEQHIGTSRTAAAKRYAGIVPGGVTTRIGREHEGARDRALNARAEALRKALRDTVDDGDEEGRARARRRGCTNTRACCKNKPNGATHAVQTAR